MQNERKDAVLFIAKEGGPLYDGLPTLETLEAMVGAVQKRIDIYKKKQSRCDFCDEPKWNEHEKLEHTIEALDLLLHEIKEAAGQKVVKITSEGVDVVGGAGRVDYVNGKFVDTPPRAGEGAPVAGVPDGWKIVPADPTPEMIDAVAWNSYVCELVGVLAKDGAIEVYRDFLNAAPSPPLYRAWPDPEDYMLLRQALSKE